jgi:glucose-6-phosphate isomerase
LAVGKGLDELKAEGAKEHLIPHLTFSGNRPSNVLLLPRLTAYEAGQLLALYEHRTVVQGFVWGINSFDQFGVELGKVRLHNTPADCDSDSDSDCDSALVCCLLLVGRC